jgi:hypothetical protein
MWCNSSNVPIRPNKLVLCAVQNLKNPAEQPGLANVALMHPSCSSSDPMMAATSTLPLSASVLSPQSIVIGKPDLRLTLELQNEMVKADVVDARLVLLVAYAGTGTPIDAFRD